MTQIEALYEHIPPMMIVAFRLGGLMVYGPIFGSDVIPLRVKVLLVALITLAVYPLLSAQHFAGVPMELNLWLLGPIVVMEVLFGMVIGYIASLPLVGLQTGGLVMGQQMGLGFAQFYNPAIDDEADIVGQMIFFMALAGFVLIGGHEAMVLAVLHSFSHVPPGGFMADVSVLALVGGMLLSAFEIALRVAAPLLAIIFLQSMAMGYISKTVPQLNILSLGFPMRILIGFGIVALGLFVIDEVAMEGIDHMLQSLFEWIESQSLEGRHA